jgi:cytochrome bd-type quinol oxidase subunit 1
MTPQEKTLYHQIHPLKLATDISAEIVSLYLFWKHRLLAGMLVVLVPPIIVSLLIIKLVDLETYKQSTLGRYIRVSMTPSAVVMRILGTVITHVGAWSRKPWLIPLGLLTVLLGWLRGKLLPNTRTQ